MLIVQIVTCWWTKSFRGAEGALIRRDLPRAFPIDGPRDGFLLEHLRLDAATEFAPRLVKRETRPSAPGHVDELRIGRVDQNRVVLGLYAAAHNGMPRRHPVPELFGVASGEWVRLILNARHASHAGQFYSETTYNVALDSDAAPVSPAVFLASPPTREKDLRAHLF